MLRRPSLEIDKEEQEEEEEEEEEEEARYCRRSEERNQERTKTLLSLFSALLSAAVLFFASLSGARSRGNLVAVLGLRLPERLVLWFSLTCWSPLSSEPSVGSGRDAVAPFDSEGRDDDDLSDGSGVGGLFAPAEAVAGLIAGSCGPCSGITGAGAGGGAGALC